MRKARVKFLRLFWAICSLPIHSSARKRVPSCIIPNKIKPEAHITTQVNKIYQTFMQTITRSPVHLYDRTPSKSKDKHSPRQHRRQISKITQGMPPGQYIAYCVVSKESQMGLFVHERLLALDSFRQQLSYYSDVPELPLTHTKELGKAKQSVNFKNAIKFEFVLERIRLGHVTVSWSDRKQSHTWKLIMGSNALAQKFYEMIQENMVKKQPAGKPKVEPGLSPQHRTINRPPTSSEPHLPSVVTRPVSVKVEHPSVRHEEAQQHEEQSEQKMQKIRKNIVIDSQRQLHTESSPKFTHFAPLKIKTPAPPPQPAPSGSLVSDWLLATNGHERALVYSKFMTLCKTKVTDFTDNFYYNHMKHEEEEGMCVWWQGQLKVMYCPLLDSVEDEGPVNELVEKIRKEEAFVRGWESLNYLSGFDKVGEVKIGVPMSCMVTYNSMLFFCRSTIEQIPGKYRINDWNEHESLVKQLQERIHTKAITGLQKAYWIEFDNLKCLYFQQLWCLPDISSLHPISHKYLSEYITRGVISSQKDKQAIRDHINSTLLQGAIQIIHTKQITTSFELMHTISQLGLSQHYLPLLLVQARSKNTFVQRLVMSEIVAVAVEWQIRRKMQLQLFRKKQKGYAINQVKFSLNQLVQGQKHYLKTVAKIIEEYFGQIYDISSCPIETYIIVENTFISVLYRIGLDCRVFVEPEQKGWLFNPKNIDNNIELTLFPKTKTYRNACFCPYQDNYLSRQLFEEHTYQLNSQISLLSVLSLLNFRQNAKSQYQVSPEYELLSQEAKLEVDYFLSHYVQARIELKPQQLIQSQIYRHYHSLNYCVSSLEYLTALNRVRWMIKAGQQHQVYSLVQEMISRATIWGQYAVLIQIYGFYSQYKLRIGDVSTAVGYSQKALRAAFEHYQNQRTVMVALLIAEQAFEAANIHLSICNYSKAIELYGNTESILQRLSTEGQQFTLNPEFIDLYSKKCGIYLLFGEYQNCLDGCLQGINCCARIKDFTLSGLLNQYEFKIYGVLFRCYQMQKMRRQMIEVADICTQKYVIDKMVWGEEVSEGLTVEVLKLLWESTVKEIQSVSPISEKGGIVSEEVKYVYLKKVHREVRALKTRVRDVEQLDRKQVIEYLKLRVMKEHREDSSNTIKIGLIKCLIAVTNSPLPAAILPPSKSNLDDPFTLLICFANLIGYSFLLGSLQNSLHLYSFEY